MTLQQIQTLAINSGGPNLAGTVRIHGAERAIVTCYPHLTSVGSRGGVLSTATDVGSYEACLECGREAVHAQRESLRFDRGLVAIGVTHYGRQTSDEGDSGQVWFAFPSRLADAEPEYGCSPGATSGEIRHTEQCVEDTYQRRSACELSAEDDTDPALELLNSQAGVSLYARKCHNGDWDCCGRRFYNEPWVRRSNGWTLVTQSWGLDV
jgi:hypothetical protein